MDFDEFTRLACEGRFFSREDAGRDLSSKRGINIAASTLAKSASTSEGPDFLGLGRAVYYQVSELDRWLQEHLKRPGRVFINLDAP